MLKHMEHFSGIFWDVMRVVREHFYLIVRSSELSKYSPPPPSKGRKNKIFENFHGSAIKNAFVGSKNIFYSDNAFYLDIFNYFFKWKLLQFQTLQKFWMIFFTTFKDNLLFWKPKAGYFSKLKRRGGDFLFFFFFSFSNGDYIQAFP